MFTFVTLAIGFILVTLCGTIILLRQAKENRARFLLAMVGLISVFHGLRLLTDSGLSGFRGVAGYEGMVDLMVTVLTFAALLILYSETTRHRLTQVRLRLSQANESPVPLPRGKGVSHMVEQKQLATRSADRGGTLPPELALDRLMKESPVAIVALDEAGRVCTCNAAAEKLYSAESGALLGKLLPSLRNRKAKSAQSGKSNLHTAEAHS